MDNDYKRSLSIYSRCDILLVPTRLHEYQYVKSLGDKVEQYDSSNHIIYLKEGTPIIVCTLSTGIKDGIVIKIDRIMVALMPSPNIPDVIKWFKKWEPAIENINLKYLDTVFNSEHDCLRGLDQ